MDRLGGTHLIIDGYVRSEDRLDHQNIFKMFDRLVSGLGMSYLTKPVMAEVPKDQNKISSEEEDDGGTSYFCQITTSHIALHTWPLRKAFMMDIFSCVEFDVRLALETVRRHLGLTEFCYHVVTRTDPKFQEKSL